MTKNNKSSQQLKGQIDVNKKKIGFKNFWIYVLFNFIYGFLLPMTVILLDVLWMKIQGNETATTFQLIIYLLEAIILFTINEYLVCKTTNKATDSSYLLGKYAFAFNCITILFITYIMFFSINSFSVKFLETWWIGICIGLILSKIISYIIVKKYVLKEKIDHKNLLFGCFGTYILLIFIVFHFLIPSNINKFLFNIFGSTEFSSKEFKIYLTDLYAENCGNASYFNDFTDKELECFDDIKFENQKFTTDDLSKLKYLKRLEIDNTVFDRQIDFSKNSELEYLNIIDSTIDNLSSQLLGNVSSLYLEKVNANTIDIKDGNLKELTAKESKIENFKVQGTIIEKINSTKMAIKALEVSNTMKLSTLNIEDSTIESVLLDNNIGFENKKNSVNVDKINTLELKNVKNIDSLLQNSEFTFKEIKLLDNKGFKLDNNSYLKLEHANLYVPEKTKVKELILENMTAIVIDHYHDKISCDETTCIYDDEEKTKIQGPDSMLGDTIELYDSDNNQLFKWHVFDYKKMNYRKE